MGGRGWRRRGEGIPGMKARGEGRGEEDEGIMRRKEEA